MKMRSVFNVQTAIISINLFVSQLTLTAKTIDLMANVQIATEDISYRMEAVS